MLLSKKAFKVGGWNFVQAWNRYGGGSGYSFSSILKSIKYLGLHLCSSCKWEIPSNSTLLFLLLATASYKAIIFRTLHFVFQ